MQTAAGACVRLFQLKMSQQEAESETGCLTWLALTALLSDCLKEISPEASDANVTPMLCLSDKRL